MEAHREFLKIEIVSKLSSGSTETDITRLTTMQLSIIAVLPISERFDSCYSRLVTFTTLKAYPSITLCTFTTEWLSRIAQNQ